MDTPQQPVQPTVQPMLPPPSSGFLGTRVPSLVAFLAGCLLFLLPFAEIKCGDTVLANKSGLDIALKKEWKSPKKTELMGNDSNSGLSDSQKKQQGNSWIFAMGGLALGALGLLLCFADSRTGGSAGTGLGVLAGGALVGLMIQLKHEFNDSLTKSAADKGTEGANDMGFGNLSNAMNNVKPALSFTPWFYVAMVAFFVAAIFCYLRMRSARR